MLRPVIELFSSSFLGRIIGLLRFQAILYVFGQNILSDSIIYFTAFIWLVNNFFVIPSVNSSLIADLGANDEEHHITIIQNLVKRVFKLSVLTGVLSLIIVIFLYGNKGIMNLDVISVSIILVIFPLLGINEIFSLYNQYKENYFLYSFNPVVWNSVLIIGLIFYWLFEIENLWFYFLFLLIAKVLTVTVQYKYSKLKLTWGKEDKRGKKTQNTGGNHNIYYNLSIIIFSGISFFDLNILSKYSVVGTVTVYTIFLKIPSLLQTIVASSTLPVFFNRIVLKQSTLVKSIAQFVGLTLLLFLGIAIVYLIMGKWLFSTFFNYELAEIDIRDIYFSLIYMLVSTLSFFFIRLSVEYKYQKIIFASSVLAVIIKLAATKLYVVDIRNLLLVNMIVFGIIFITGIFSIFKKNNSNENLTA